MSTEIVIAIFPSRQLLTDALDHIIHVRDLNIRRSAILAKAANGETVVIGDDISADEGGIAGGTLGAAILALGLVQLGALSLPGVGPVVAIFAGLVGGGLLGGATGRVAANLLDFGIKLPHVGEFVHRLQMGRPALVIEVLHDPHMLDRLRQELILFQAEFIQQAAATPAPVQ